MKEQKLDDAKELLKLHRLKPFLELTYNIYLDLIKVFYTNLDLNGKNLVSTVKGVQMMIAPVVWSNITRLKQNGVKVGKGNTTEINEFNKMQFYHYCLKD